MTELPRPARPDDADAIVDLWYAGWHDAHAAICDPALVARRDRAEFATRVPPLLTMTRVITDARGLTGFAVLRDDEVYQFFVAGRARGTGIAAILLADAERALAGRGAGRGWLSCTVGNDRAARFYVRHGWDRVATVTEDVETASGPFPVTVWRFEKALDPA